MLCWVPGHHNIEENELADQLAASVQTNIPSISMGVPASDLKPFLRKKLRFNWQHLWDRETQNKLHVIKLHLGNLSPISKIGSTQVTLCRLRIGHTHSTHTYLLSSGDPLMCNHCGEPLSMQGKELEVQREKHFSLPFREHLPLHPYGK